MSLLSKLKSNVVVSAAVPDDEMVIGYLTDLESKDYTKIVKVVNIYREADKKAKKVMHTKDDEFTDDELASIFLLDEPPKKPKAKKK